MAGTLYKLEFASGKSYIGITVNEARKRFAAHARDARNGSGNLVHRAWRKHGEPRMTVLAVIDDADLPKAEQSAIKEFGTLHPTGYNMVPGGNISPMHMPEIVAKVAAKMRITMRGKNHPNFGKHLTAETRARIGAKSRGRKPMLGKRHSDATRLKMSAAAMGRKYPVDWLKNMRAAGKRYRAGLALVYNAGCP